MFGVTKFHQYIPIKKFKIITDKIHLIRLFHQLERYLIHSPRILRWLLIFAGYDYTIQYHEGKTNEMRIHYKDNT